MVEAWFFAAAGALSTAGVAAGTQVHFADTTDPESFVTDDPTYLDATESECPKWLDLPKHRQKKQRPKWLGSQARENHPKGYVQWLCREPDAKNCTGYSETSKGGDALAGLDWATISGRNPAHFPLLRALVEDLADGLATEPTLKIGSPVGNPPTLRSGAPRDALLRNL